MVDREQEQARLLAESMGANGRAGRDLAWIVVASLVVIAIVVATQGDTGKLDWRSGYSDRSLDALVALLVLIPIGATVYAKRRYRDSAQVRATLDDLSFTDGLTGLANRRFLGQPFEDLLKRARRENSRIAVLFIDLDGFKVINEAYGHEVGDELMVEVADRLKKAVGTDDVVVRYGGDQFALLCTAITTTTSAERIAKRVLNAIEDPFELRDERLRISGSVGIALTEERPTRADEVLSDADAAMYQARAAGPGRYALFDRSMREKITPATAERRLRQALENGEFRLYYQPIVSLWTKRLVGVEALLRWDDADRGLISPAEFMPALENTGLIVPVGRWIIEEVCRQSHQWQMDHPDRPALTLKINVSARQLAQANFITHLRKALVESKANPDQICIEITEAALMYDVDSAWSTLREAKGLGVSLALDDFGTGYSSLSYLRRFSLDVLSIDRSFIAGIGNSREDTTIVEHMIGMAKALGIVTVAAGVETEEQVTTLRAMSCDLAQGWYFSHPQPPDVITQLLDNANTVNEWSPPEQPSEDVEAPVVKLDRFEPATAPQ